MVRSPTISSLLLSAIVLLSAALASGAELTSTLADQQMVAVTIYNDDLALIKDQRRLSLMQGENKLAFREVSGRMQPETALLRSIDSDTALRVQEQNFDFDLLTPQKLLEKYVGRQVGVVKTHPTTGEETVEQAVVLSANNGVVLRIGDHIETGVPGRLIFPDVPANLRDRPTLTMTVASDTDKPQIVELSYLSGGLGWKADYVAELNSDDTRIDLNGWVTLTNTSGTSYPNALLQLVAGDIHRAPQPQVRQRMLKATEAVMAASVPEMAEEGLFEYHLYTLERPATILDNQTKQVALLQAADVACGKEYLLQGQQYYYGNRFGDLGEKLKAEVFLTLTNSKADKLGLPLPKGVVRVYKRDSGGRVQFVGEDRVDHTPENETIRLKLGNAFDVTAEKKQTDFKKIAGFGRYNYVYESSYQLIIKNAKEEAITVKVIEPMPGDWEIINESQPHEKATASTALWQVAVPAKGTATLTYTARIKQ